MGISLDSQETTTHILLHKSYTVLTCTGALHFQRPMNCKHQTQDRRCSQILPIDHVLDTFHDLLLVSWFLRVIHDSSMKVSVSNVPQSTRKYAESIQVLLRHL